MAFQTNIANLIVPEVFNPYFMEETAEKVRVLAPMTTNDPEISERFRNSGSRLVQLPFFKDLDGDSQGLAVGTEITVSRINSEQDRARRHMRAKGWTVNDLESELTAEDPLAAIISRVSNYWSREIQSWLFASLDGVFADNVANDASDLVEDVVGTTVGEGLLTRTVLAKAKNKLGDSGDILNTTALHSDVYTDLQIRDQIRDERDSDANLAFESFAGYRIIVDDSIGFEADVEIDTGVNDDVYTTYLFAPNSVAYGDNFADVPSELDRKAELSETRFFTRIHFMIHPRGFRWEESTISPGDGGETPTKADVQNAANWDRVYEKKNVRIVKIRHQVDLS